jgi:hypothetical protein
MKTYRVDEARKIEALKGFAKESLVAQKIGAVLATTRSGDKAYPVELTFKMRRCDAQVLLDEKGKRKLPLGNLKYAPCLAWCRVNAEEE